MCRVGWQKTVNFSIVVNLYLSLRRVLHIWLVTSQECTPCDSVPNFLSSRLLLNPTAGRRGRKLVGCFTNEELFLQSCFPIRRRVSFFFKSAFRCADQPWRFDSAYSSPFMALTWLLLKRANPNSWVRQTGGRGGKTGNGFTWKTDMKDTTSCFERLKDFYAPAKNNFLHKPVDCVSTTQIRCGVLRACLWPRCK